MTRDLRRPVLRALSWATGMKAAGQIASWAITLYVIRLLAPEDYGLMALAMVFVGIMAPVAELGIGASLIQARELSETLSRKLAGFALLTGAGLALLLGVLAPVLSAVGGAPELTAILATLSASLVLTAFGIVPRAVLMRGLDLRTTSTIDLLGTLCGGGLTLYLAVRGHGVWALVWGHLLSQALISTALLQAARCPRVPSFDFRGVAPSLAFGGWVTLDRLLWSLWSRIDLLIIGRMLGEAPLGHYAVAKELAQLPQTKVQGIINAVAFPAYSEAARDGGDPVRFLLKYIRLSALLAFPVFWGLALATPLLIDLLLGPKWAAAALPMQVITVFMPLRVAQSAVSPYLQAIGQARVSSTNMALGVVLITALVTAGAHWGLLGASLGWALSAGLLLLVVLLRAARVSALRPSAVLATLLRASTPALVMTAAVLMLDAWVGADLHGAVRLAFMVLSGTVSYVGTILIWRREEVGELMRLVRPR